MTQDEIIALLEKAKLGATGSFGFLVFKTVGLKELTEFANLVAAEEREACAKVCETINSLEDYYGERIELACAESIRARGQA